MNSMWNMEKYKELRSEWMGDEREGGTPDMGAILFLLALHQTALQENVDPQLVERIFDGFISESNRTCEKPLLSDEELTQCCFDVGFRLFPRIGSVELGLSLCSWRSPISYTRLFLLLEATFRGRRMIHEQLESLAPLDGVTASGKSIVGCEFQKAQGGFDWRDKLDLPDEGLGNGISGRWVKFVWMICEPAKERDLYIAEVEPGGDTSLWRLSQKGGHSKFLSRLPEGSYEAVVDYVTRLRSNLGKN